MFAGLVVPDVPLEETETLRMEAKKKGIELVCFSYFISWFQMECPYTVARNDRVVIKY